MSAQSALSHCTLHCTLHFALHIALCTAHCTLHCTSHFILHIALCTAHCTLCCTLHFVLQMVHLCYQAHRASLLCTSHMLHFSLPCNAHISYYAFGSLSLLTFQCKIQLQGTHCMYARVHKHKHTVIKHTLRTCMAHPLTSPLVYYK